MEDDDAVVDRLVRLGVDIGVGMSAQYIFVLDHGYRLPRVEQSDRCVGAGGTAADDTDIAGDCLDVGIPVHCSGGDCSETAESGEKCFQCGPIDTYIWVYILICLRYIYIYVSNCFQSKEKLNRRIDK